MNVQIPSAFRFLWSAKADDGGAVRYRTAWGGRGSAKSHSFAQALVLKGAERQLRIGCFREVQLTLKESVKQLLEDKIAAAGLQGFYRSLENEIRGANGTQFIFRGLRAIDSDGIKSMEGLDIAWVEEASSVSLKSLSILRPTIRKAGSEIWFTYNPSQPTDPVDVMFRGEAGPPPGSIVRRVNYDQNPWFAASPMAGDMEYDRRRDADAYAHIWLGEYRRNSEARVFRNWSVEQFETPANAVLRFGADWGFAVDPTVLLRTFIGRWENGQAIADVNGRTLFIDHEAYKVGCEIDETPALFAGSDPKGRWENPHGHPGIPGAQAWLITADSSRPETVSFMKRRGFRIHGAIKGPGSVEDGIEFLKSFDIVVHPRCRHTITELTLYSWKTDELTGQILPVLADKNNHLIDAARYACEGVRRARKPAAQPQTAATPKDYRGARKGGEDEWMAA